MSKQTTNVALRRPKSLKPFMPDLFICVEQNEKGETVRVVKDRSTLQDPLSRLSYTDFELGALLKAGVNLKSLAISPDMRIGHDDEIDAYNKRLESLAGDLYNVESES